MNISVFGASGVVGRVLVPELIRLGHKLVAMQHKTALPFEGVAAVEGSIADPDAVAATVADADAVLQLTKGGGGIEQAVETSARGTINILDAVRKSGKVRQYLLTSSDAATGICARPHPAPISHETPPQSYGDYYSLGKVLEETIAADYHRNFAVPYTIARLSWVQRDDSVLRHLIAGYDPGRGAFSSSYSPEQKARLERGERFVVLPCDESRRPLGRTLVERDDVISALLAMVGNPRAIDERFHVSGPGFRYDRPCAYLAEKLALPVERVTVPGYHSFDIDCSHTTERLGWRAKFDVIAMIDAALARAI